MTVSTENSLPAGDGVRDEGHHFSNLGIADWNTWLYEWRICRASSVANEDLVKLKMLFEMLWAHVSE